MASKAGSTDRRMVHKRGHDKQTWHVKASSLLLWGVGDKSRKNWIILLPDLWIQWARVKTVPGNNLSSHDLNPLWARASSHTLDPVLHHGDEKTDFFFSPNDLLQHYHPLFCPFLLLFVHGMSSFVCSICVSVVCCMHANTFATHISVCCWLSLIPNRDQGELEHVQAVTGWQAGIRHGKGCQATTPVKPIQYRPSSFHLGVIPSW